MVLCVSCTTTPRMSTQGTIRFSKEAQSRIKNEYGKMGESFEKAIIRLLDETKPQENEG